MEPRFSRNGAVRFSLTFWLMWGVGMLLALLMLALLAYSKAGAVEAPYRTLAVLAALGSVPIYTVLTVYHKGHGYVVGLGRLLAGWTALQAALLAIMFVTKTGELYSREVILGWAVLGFLVQATAYLPMLALARHYHQQLRTGRKSLIVGDGPLAVAVARKLTQLRGEPLMGLVSTTVSKVEKRDGFRVIGALHQLRQLIARNAIRRVYIALPVRETDRVEKLYIDLLDANVDVIWMPDLANLMLLNHSVHTLDGMPALHLNESPLTAYQGGALLKAVMDRTVALLGILLLSPLMLGVAVAVKLSSPGPILFRQKRHGRDGKIIDVLKFRSMYMHPEDDATQATRDDPRITPVGRWIRRTSIDELPQLFNVLRGEMSLVGPRPHAVAHNNYYADKIIAYMARHRIKPGITGLAQVQGYRGETETLEEMQKRVELDLEYINNWSLWLDIKTLIKTPFALGSRNAY